MNREIEIALPTARTTLQNRPRTIVANHPNGQSRFRLRQGSMGREGGGETEVSLLPGAFPTLKLIPQLGGQFVLFGGHSVVQLLV